MFTAHTIIELDDRTTVTTIIDDKGRAYVWTATASGADVIIAHNGLRLKSSNPMYKAIEEYAVNNIC